MVGLKLNQTKQKYIEQKINNQIYNFSENIDTNQNLPVQIYQTKYTSPNPLNQIYSNRCTEINLPKKIYWTKSDELENRTYLSYLKVASSFWKEVEGIPDRWHAEAEGNWRK